MAAKLGAGSVVVGLGGGETYLASDIPAILPYTRDVVILEDGEMARITREGAELMTLDGRRVERAATRIDWDAAMAQKGGYRHFMLKEIHEQPRAVADTLRGRLLVDGAAVSLPEARPRRRPRRTAWSASSSWPAARPTTPRWSAAS